MKIFLDDERTPKSNDYIIIRDPELCINSIKDNWEKITHISLDHDLGVILSGYNVLKFIVDESIYNNKIVNFVINIHTANPVGRRNMKYLLNDLIRFQMYQPKK